MLTIFLISLTIIAVIALVCLYLKHNKDKYQIKTAGVIQDYWDKYSVAILALGSALLTGFFGIDKLEFEEVFGSLGEIVRLLDGLVGLVSVTYVIVKSWFRKTMFFLLAISLSFLSATSTYLPEYEINVCDVEKNPFKYIVQDQKDFQTQSIGSVANGLLEFGKLVFSDDIKSAIAGRLDPECKRYKEELMNDGRKYRQLQSDFYDFQNSID